MKGWGRAVKTLVRSPDFTLLALATMTVCLGAASAVFAIANRVVLAPLPFPSANRLVIIHDRIENQAATLNPVSPAQYVAWSSASRTIEQFGAFTDAYFNVTTPEGLTRRFSGLRISPGVLNLFGIEGMDTESAQVLRPGVRPGILVSPRFWESHFGQERFSQKNLLIDDLSHTIVGILPPGAYFLGRKVDVVAPLPPLPLPNTEANHRFRYLSVIGRLRAADSITEAQQELEAISRQLAIDFPATEANRSVTIRHLETAFLGDAKLRLRAVGLAVFVLLLIALINLSSLSLAKAVSSRGVNEVRLALGASRGDLIWTTLQESLVVCVGGALLGLLGAKVVVALTKHFVSEDTLPRVSSVVLDGEVWFFAIAVGAVCAGVMAILPAFQWASLDLVAMRDHQRASSPGRSAGKIRAYLMVAEIALAIFLSVAATLAATSFGRLLSVDPGFSTKDRLVTDISLPRNIDPDARGRMLEDIVESSRQIPGVYAAGLTNRLPLTGESNSRSVNLGSAPNLAAQHVVEVRRVSPEFREAIGMSLRRGQPLSGNPPESAQPEVLVNESFVRAVIPDGEPIGRQVFIHEGTRPASARIVGVVSDVHNLRLDASPQPELYLSAYSSPSLNASLVLRTTLPAEAFQRDFTHRIARVAPGASVGNIHKLSDLVEQSLGPAKLYSSLLLFFAAAATLLATVGIYGVTSYMISQRRLEMATRIALGADQTAILSLIASWLLKIVLTGFVLGALVAALITHVLSSILYGVSEADIATCFAAALTVGLLALSGGIPSAWYASRIDPSLVNKT